MSYPGPQGAGGYPTVGGELLTDPTVGADQGALFWQDDSGTTNIHWSTSAGEIQITDGLALNTALISMQLTDLTDVTATIGSGSSVLFQAAPTVSNPRIADIYGGTGSGDDLTLHSTVHATKGSILFGSSDYDEVNNRLGLRLSPTVATLEVDNAGNAGAGGVIAIMNASTGTSPVFFRATGAVADGSLQVLTDALSGTGQRDSYKMDIRGVAHDGATAYSADWRYFVDVTSNVGVSQLTWQEGIDGIDTPANFTTRMRLLSTGILALGGETFTPNTNALLHAQTAKSGIVDIILENTTNATSAINEIRVINNVGSGGATDLGTTATGYTDSTVGGDMGFVTAESGLAGLRLRHNANNFIQTQVGATPITLLSVANDGSTKSGVLVTNKDSGITALQANTIFHVYGDADVNQLMVVGKITGTNDENGYISFTNGAAANTSIGFIGGSHHGGSSGSPLIDAADALVDSIVIRSQAAFQVATNGGTHALTVDTSQQLGINTTTPDRRFHVEDDTALTNTVTYAQRLSHITSGTPAANIGVGIEFEVETSASNNEILGTIEVIASDAGAGTEDGDIVFKNMTGGAAAAEKMRLTGDGQLGIGVTPLHKLHVSDTTAGSTTRFRIDNLDNTNTDSHTQVTIAAGGTSGGDPYLSFNIPSGSPNTWSVGMDNDAGDVFKVSRAGTIGTNDAMTINATNDTTFGGTVTATGNLDVNGGNGVFVPSGWVRSGGVAASSYIAGQLVVGTSSTSPSGVIDADQDSASGALPVHYIRQRDISEEFAHYHGSAAAGVLTQSIVDNGDVTTPTLQGWLKIFVTDDGNQITDQAYFLPIYTIV